MSSYTQEQIDSLQSAIAQGVLTVEYGDKKVTYRSLDEMLQLLGIMQGAVNPQSRSKRYYAQHSSGK